MVEAQPARHNDAAAQNGDVAPGMQGVPTVSIELVIINCTDVAPGRLSNGDLVSHQSSCINLGAAVVLAVHAHNRRNMCGCMPQYIHETPVCARFLHYRRLT